MPELFRLEIQTSCIRSRSLEQELRKKKHRIRRDHRHLEGRIHRHLEGRIRRHQVGHRHLGHIRRHQVGRRHLDRTIRRHQHLEGYVGES